MGTAGGQRAHSNTHKRLLGSLYLIWEGLSVLVYGHATWKCRHIYRRPRLAVALWLLMATELAYTTARVLRRRRVDRHVVWGDTAAAVAVQILFPLAYGAPPGPNQSEWVDWRLGLREVHAEAVSFALPSWPERAAVVAALSTATSLGAVLGPGRAEASEPASATALVAFRMVMTGLLADTVKANVTRLEAAQAGAVRSARDAGRADTRARYVTYMQGRALGVLDAIASAADPRDAGIRKAASIEAARLRHLILPDDLGGPTVLAGVLDQARAVGIDVEVVMGEVDPEHDLSAATVDELGRELMAFAAPVAQGVERILLFLDVVDGELLATIRGSAARRELRVAL